MSGDLLFIELPANSYPGTIDKIRFGGRATVYIALTYKIETPNGDRRLNDRWPLVAPPSAATYDLTALGKSIVQTILKTLGKTLAEVDAAGGVKSLPGLLKGCALRVVTENKRVGDFNCPVVKRIEPPT